MDWPAPTDRPVAPPPFAPALPRAAPDRPGTARPVAAWLAAVGGSLVLVAAVIVVAGNWQDIAPWIKGSVLLVATAAVIAAAERWRTAVPATARALAHLGVAMVAPLMIAATAVVGGTWPTCVIAGGVGAAVAGEVQRRRWGAPLLEMATVVAVGLALTGLAARLSVPVGLLGAVGAVAFLLARRHSAAAVLAVASLGPTLIVTLTERRIGPGTLARIGATGDALAWSAPIAGVLAGGVLAIVATRRHQAPLAAAALLAPVIGVTASLAELEAGPVLTSSAAALGVLAVQVVAVVVRSRPWDGLAPVIADHLAVLGSVVAVWAPFVAVEEPSAPLPIAIGLAALLVAWLRLRNHDLLPLVAAGAVSTAIALVASTGVALPTLAVTSAALAAAVMIVDRRGRAAAAVLVGVGWSMVWLLRTRPDEVASPAAVLAVAVSTIVVVELALRHVRRSDPITAIIAAAGAGSLGIVVVSDVARPALFVATWAAVVLHVAWRRPSESADVVVAAACATAISVSAALADAPLDLTAGIGLVTLAGAATITWWRSAVGWTAHLAAVAATTAVPFGLAAIGADGTEIAVASLLGAVVLTGWSYVTIRITPLATAGLTAGLQAGVIAAAAGADVLASLGAVVVGSQALLHGATRRSSPLAAAGAALSGVGAFSLWFTAGANDAVLRTLAPFGVTGADLAVAAASSLLLGAGWLAGRRTILTSWVTTSPGIVLAVVWLVAAEVARDVRWSLPALLTVGLVAAASGGVRRLAAPLVLGTATIASTVMITTGPRLAQLDSWAWLTIGGLLLIGVAVAVERTVGDDDRDGLDWRHLRETWR